MDKKQMIEGVIITPLKQIEDENGKVMHMLRKDSKVFKKFGEIYFSCGYPDVVKAWHIHKEMTLNNCCVVGMIKLVLYDSREGSSTKGEIMELFIGEDNYCLVQYYLKLFDHNLDLAELSIRYQHASQ